MRTNGDCEGGGKSSLLLPDRSNNKESGIDKNIVTALSERLFKSTNGHSGEILREVDIHGSILVLIPLSHNFHPCVRRKFSQPIRSVPPV